MTLLGLFVKKGNPAEQLYGDLMRDYKNGQKKQRMIDTMFKKKEPSANAPSKWKEML